MSVTLMLSEYLLSTQETKLRLIILLYSVTNLKSNLA